MHRCLRSTVTASGAPCREMCQAETSSETAQWREIVFQGPVPTPRKAAAAAYTNGRIVLFGGTGLNENEEQVVLDEWFVFTLDQEGNLHSSCCPTSSGAVPCGRTGAILQEYQPGAAGRL
jgi:hypothetical protein